MRPITLLSLTVATLFAAPLHGCGPKRSALDIASSQPATTTPGPTTAAPPATTPPAAAPPAASTPAPATPAAPAPVATTAPPATSPAPASKPAPAPALAPAPQGSPECLAGCNSPSLAPEVQHTCRIQCARLAQQPAATPAAPAQPQPDYVHQRALCESSCDNERDAGDRHTCRLNCSHIGPSAPAYPAGGSSYPSGGTPASANRQQEIAACQATCDREASATDRATCRNNCGAYGTYLGTSGPSGYVAGPTPGMSPEEQRAAVIRSSGGVVSGGPAPATPPAQPPPGYQPPNPQCAAQAQSCKVACASEQTACNSQCDQGKMSETDRATCKLTCSGAGDACRDDCRIKEGACKPAVYK